MKHEKAYCKNGKIYEPQDIKSRNSLVEMRYHGLTDIHKQFELVAVNSSNPFFRFKNSPGLNLTRKESNPNHNKVKSQIIEALQKAETLQVYTNDFIDEKMIESSLINLDKESYSTYSWKMEAFKKISQTGFSYFDICGFSRDIPFSSSVKPTIFIEVVLSSFLKEKVFEFHCKSSKIDNTICLFFYIPEILPKKDELSNYWNVLQKNDNGVRIRVTQFIDNGYFYSGKNQIAHLKLDKKNEFEEFERPDFPTLAFENQYWEKHHIYIIENYFKKAQQKLNSRYTK